MPAGELISSYDAMWQLEATFQMSRANLREGPMFNHLRESFGAHLTIVFTALMIARYLQNGTGSSTRHIFRTLLPQQHVTITLTLAGRHITAEP